MGSNLRRNARAYVLRHRRAFTLAELIADGIVHGVGLLVAIVAGTVLITLAVVHATGAEIAAVAIYVGSFVALLSASMAFNLCPMGPIKAWLARIDQAAIFLFIAGSYTPLLIALGDVAVADKLLIFVWATALIGIALKLLVPQHFGRLAIPFYLAIGWPSRHWQPLSRRRPFGSWSQVAWPIRRVSFSIFGKNSPSRTCSGTPSL